MRFTSINKRPISKVLVIFPTLCFLAFILLSCKKEGPTKPISNSKNKIMVLGASRVEGDRPHYESFRYELWKLLVADAWEFDFIGTATDNACYPKFGELNFDPDHEGRGGWTSGQILEGLPNWIEETAAPDILLFSSPGGNDILNGLSYSQMVANINEIIDILQAQNPNITIIIEQMAPGKSSFMSPEFTMHFQNMQQEVLNIATQQSSPTSQVITIDLFTGFDDSQLADDVHYNEVGAKFIADRYYALLTNLLIP